MYDSTHQNSNPNAGFYARVSAFSVEFLWGRGCIIGLRLSKMHVFFVIEEKKKEANNKHTMSRSLKKQDFVLISGPSSRLIGKSQCAN